MGIGLQRSGAEQFRSSECALGGVRASSRLHHGKREEDKTDRNDARGLAQILRTGWYSRVHVKSLQSHQVRALLASRKAILKKCVDLENELRVTCPVSSDQ